MNLARSTAAFTIPLIIAGTAWIAPAGSTGPGFAHTLLALMAFALMLTGEMSMGFLFVILSLIILVAVINLISMLMMLVTDKQADIAILRTLGATPRSIMGMFMVQGVLVGIVGIGFGVGLGSLM